MTAAINHDAALQALREKIEAGLGEPNGIPQRNGVGGESRSHHQQSPKVIGDMPVGSATRADTALHRHRPGDLLYPARPVSPPEPVGPFGWDAVYGEGAMFAPPLVEPKSRAAQVEDALAAIRQQMEDAA